MSCSVFFWRLKKIHLLCLWSHSSVIGWRFQLPPWPLASSCSQRESLFRLSPSDSFSSAQQWNLLVSVSLSVNPAHFTKPSVLCDLLTLGRFELPWVPWPNHEVKPPLRQDPRNDTGNAEKALLTLEFCVLYMEHT